MTKSSRIRIEAEDAATEVFDQVADKALSRMKDVGDAGKFAIQLGARFEDLTEAMRGNSAASEAVGAAAKEAGAGLGAMGSAVAGTIIQLEKLLSIGKAIVGNDKLLALLRGIGALGTGTVAAIGSVATVAAGAAYVGAKVSEQDSRNEEAGNRRADPRTLSKHYNEFYQQAAQDLGAERTSQLAAEANRYSGIAGTEGSRQMFYESVRVARQQKQVADAAAAEREALAATARGKGSNILAGIGMDLHRQQRLAELDTRGRAELEKRTQIDAAKLANPTAVFDPAVVESIVKAAGDWAVKAKQVADEKERELDLAMRAAEQYQELTRGADALRRRLMSDSDRRAEEEAELLAMALQGAIDEWTYKTGLVDIAARYAKPPDVERELRGPTRWADAPRGGDLYSQSLTRGPGELAPEVIAQQTRKETLREIQWQRRLLTELLTQFRGAGTIVLDTQSL